MLQRCRDGGEGRAPLNLGDGAPHGLARSERLGDRRCVHGRPALRRYSGYVDRRCARWQLKPNPGLRTGTHPTVVPTFRRATDRACGAKLKLGRSATACRAAAHGGWRACGGRMPVAVSRELQALLSRPFRKDVRVADAEYCSDRATAGQRTGCRWETRKAKGREKSGSNNSTVWRLLFTFLAGIVNKHRKIALSAYAVPQRVLKPESGCPATCAARFGPFRRMRASTTRRRPSNDRRCCLASGRRPRPSPRRQVRVSETLTLNRPQSRAQAAHGCACISHSSSHRRGMNPGRSGFLRGMSGTGDRSGACPAIRLLLSRPS